MRRTSISFEQVSMSNSKTGTCPVCGKKASRSKTFMQTINPFNTNKDGFVKSREEIRVELREKIEAWRKEPTIHAKCEGK